MGRQLALSSVGAVVLVALAGRACGQTGFANFEVAPVHPLEITPDGSRLLVCNTPDGRLEVFNLGGALPVKESSIPVGLEPVSVRARAAAEFFVVNQLSDSVSVVTLSGASVVATFKPGNEPCDVVFIGAGAAQRAYVSVSRENSLKVYDPNNRALPPQTIALQGTCPKALATDGTRIFAAFFEAGNRTSIAPRPIVDDPTGPWAGQNPPPNNANGTFTPATAPGLPAGPASSIIINKEGNPGNWKDAANMVWDAKVPWALQEHGVAIYTPATQALTYANNIANINMALAVQPGTGRVSVVGHHLTNYIRFEPNHRSTFGRSFLGGFDPTNPGGTTGVTDLNAHLFANGVSLPYTANPTPAQVQLSIADPRGLAWRDSTDLYIACMATDNVLHWNTSTGRMAVIAVGHGACAAVYDAARSRLYVLNRFDGTISSINTMTDTEVGRVGFFDPTPATIKQGRPVFYDAHATSKLGIVSCNSCHVDTRSDVESWDAGDPSGAMKVFNQTCDASTPFVGNCGDWHPVKGPLMTQNLADTVGNGPLHWRGEKENILAFAAGFTGFLGLAAPPPDSQLLQMQTLFQSLRRMPNPFRTITDGLPASVPIAPAGNPSNGQALFNGPPLGGVARCTDCHTLPTGGGLTIISADVLAQSQSLKAPPLRDLYVKTGFDPASNGSRRGFGFAHDGATASIAALLQNHFAPAATAQDRADLEAFLMCFPSGTHPAVGVQLTFDVSNKNDPTAIALYTTLMSLADSGQIGVVAHGIAAGLARGYQYLPGTSTFQSDRQAEVITADALRLGAGTGAETTITAVVAGTERRIGIERDGDGYLDRDELDAGADPADPTSSPCYPNCDASTTAPILNTADFTCFLQKYAAASPYANCDRSTAAPVVNTGDFTCFLQKYAAGCS
jgi:mono/diheme cytochrome c family protein